MAEQVDEISVGGLWEQMEGNISHSVVHPMEHDAWHDAIGAIVHPTDEQSHERGMYELGRVSVGNTEDECRKDDGQPVPLTVERVEQRAQDGTTEHHLLGHRHQYAQHDVTCGMAHDGLQDFLHVGRHIHVQRLDHPFRWDDGAQGQHDHPEQQCPGAFPDVDAREWRPTA